MNALYAIQPYRDHGVWVFDDQARGLLAEPLVAGIPQLLELALTEAGLNPGLPFTVLFSDHPFPSHQFALTYEFDEAGGAWYKRGKQTGWLCAALYKYFDHPPDSLYVRLQAVS